MSAVSNVRLIAASVVDADGGGSVRSRGAGLRSLPFVVERTWEAPAGFFSEEVLITGPDEQPVHRIGPSAVRAFGEHDASNVRTVVEDATFAAEGSHRATFLADGAPAGSAEFVVAFEAPPAKLPPEYEDGLRRSDLIWVGIEAPASPAGRTRRRRGEAVAKDRLVPAWFVYRQGRIYVLSALSPGPDEQTVPGIPGAGELLVVTRRKGRETALGRFRAAARVLDGEEWDQAAALLADRRRSRVGSPSERIERWRGTCAIAELIPIVAG